MALIVLASATGSPGTTTTALGLALTWPRPVVLIDADPTGAAAIQAGYFRGADLEHDATILDLLVAHRDGTLATDLPRMLTTIPGSTVGFLPGLLHHTLAPSMSPVWAPLTHVLRTLDGGGRDVIIDAGRLGLAGSPIPVIYGADLTLLTLRSTLPALRGAAPWAETLLESASMGVAAYLGALIVGPGRPYSARDVTATLGLPVVATTAYDPAAADVLSVGAPAYAPAKIPGMTRRWDRSALARSLVGAASTIRSTLDRAAADLAVKGDLT